MEHAVIMNNGDGWHALVKSSAFERCYAVHQLCRLHLKKLYPNANAELSSEYTYNLRVGMHPDREFVLAKLLALEFPLPSPKHILEGEYAVMKDR